MSDARAAQPVRLYDSYLLRCDADRPRAEFVESSMQGPPADE